MDNYGAVAWVQISLELAGRLLLADFARRIAPPGLKAGAAQATLWLAALCPFTAVYAATPLTEGAARRLRWCFLFGQRRGFRTSRGGYRRFGSPLR